VEADVNYAHSVARLRPNGLFVEFGDIIRPASRSNYHMCTESSRHPAAIYSFETSMEVMVSGRVRESTSLKFLHYIIIVSIYGEEHMDN